MESFLMVGELGEGPETEDKELVEEEEAGGALAPGQWVG